MSRAEHQNLWITLSIFSGKFLKLKISSFLQKQKTKIRNLKSRHSHESGNPGRGISRNRFIR
ncbi:hypothetical protein E0W44_10395 [Neisseria meningitidis]|nr:hypothetical protein [Neisseria meningitidis]